MVIPIAWQKFIGVCLGSAVCIYSIILYAASGFQPSILFTMLVGMALISLGLNIGESLFKVLPKIPKWDMLAIVVVAAIFVPLYSFGVYDFPHQINEDEVTIMSVSKEVSTTPNTDILGPSNYFGFPVLIFWIYGKLGAHLGGLNLQSMRTLHSLSGALIILLSYCLFRQIFDRLWALTASVILGANHSLFFISRMAMRDNSALLFEILALTLLLYGWQKRSLVWSLWGGIASGLTFYVYYPSRITFFVWIAGILAYGVFRWFRKAKSFVPILGVAVLGFLITTGPIVISSLKRPQPKSFANDQILFSPAGKAVQQHWVFAKTEKDGILTNIRNGLLTFNRPFVDEGNIYRHTGYGFVDRYTGLLIWLGLASVIFDIWHRQPKKLGEVLMLVGFLTTWLSLAFVFNKAPDYTRLLITLPFVGFLAAKALSFVAGGLKTLLHFKPLPISGGIALLGAGLVVYSNAAIAKDFYKQGKLDNSGLANTARYLEKHHNDYGSKWYFAPASDTSYFTWGDESSWRYWLGFFLQDKPLVVVKPNDPILFSEDPPAAPGRNYIMTNRELWDYSLRYNFPYKVQEIVRISPDGRLVGIRF